ncbi:MAG: hypothetical protein ACLQJR_07630 [Stellaceae bacterium]
MLGEVDLWRRLEEAITAELNSRCDGIVSGNLDGIERYRFETGFVRGLQWVLDRAQDIAKAPAAESDQGTSFDNSVGEEDAG